MYSAQLTAALSGATESQLRYWRQERDGKPALLAPSGGRRPALYSYRDVVTLRMYAQLREKLSLQRVRRAVAYVAQQLPEGEEMSAQVLRARPDGGTAVWIGPEGDWIDTVERPGQRGIPVVMEDIFRAFDTRDGRPVPDLEHPARGLVIDPDVQGGAPVAEGTRVTYDRLAGLRSDGLSVAEVRELYPWVSAEAVDGSVELAELVSAA